MLSDRKNYYEPLSLLQFDTASQELIEFLWRILPDSNQVDTDFIMPNHSRNLTFTSGFLEGVTLLNQLYDFSFEGESIRIIILLILQSWIVPINFIILR